MAASKKQCDSTLEYEAQNTSVFLILLREAENTLTLTQFGKEGEEGEMMRKKEKKLQDIVLPQLVTPH